jgi:hypothetical protein
MSIFFFRFMTSLNQALDFENCIHFMSFEDVMVGRIERWEVNLTVIIKK